PDLVVKAEPQPSTHPSAVPAAADPAPVHSSTSAPVPTPTTDQGVHEGMLATWAGRRQGIDQMVKTAEPVAPTGSMEIRLELKTEGLGPMELRAVMHDGRVGAAIGVGTPDAKAALTTELPGLQRALTERNVQLDSISIFNGSSHDSAGHESD